MFYLLYWVWVMVRILGNSIERVLVKDLNDVIYYHQQKDYSDQDFEASKDLDKAIKKGSVVVLEKFQPMRGSSGNGHSDAPAAPAVSLDDIKRAIREVLPEQNSNADALRDIIPLIISTVRQEIQSIVATMPRAQASGLPSSVSEFIGPEYIPDISTEGMVANIRVEAREDKGSDVASSLEALKAFKIK